MKKVLLILPLLCALMGSCTSDLERKLSELDAVISRRDSYTARFEAEADSLRAQLANAVTSDEKWAANDALFRHYRHYQSDTAQVYLGNLESLVGTDPERRNYVDFSSVKVLTSLRDYSSANLILMSKDTSRMDDRQKVAFIDAELYMAATMVADEMTSVEKRHEMRQFLLRERPNYNFRNAAENFERIRRPAIQMYETGRAAEAVPIIEKLYNDSDDPYDRANAAYSLAQAHIYTGDRDARKYWLAQSAIESLAIPIREHQSLYQLSNMLFEDKEYHRASRYCQLALQDALDCNYSSRILNSANSQLDIVKAIEQQDRQSRTFYISFIVVLLCLLLMILLLLYRMFRQTRTIHNINHQLEDANKIKEGYVYKYIVLSAKYMGRIEEYRRELRQAMKTGGFDALNEMLRSPGWNALDYKSFYQIFDETFLGLYPDFVDRVNELLQPEARFKLRNDRELPTGLRILAVIKLGIVDSGKIAEFLNCAPTSVYTHRSKIRKMALKDPDNFESAIMNI